uniref:Uncharacterized protein n=1 Tax=Nelumbo nucifera TaxID=4432 RepID=A0A822Z3R9_NELNU|nr:TPA_asm: hypothetical protein HUJ06_008962 [Nelumbo nucifera]
MLSTQPPWSLQQLTTMSIPSSNNVQSRKDNEIKSNLLKLMPIRGPTMH